MDLWTSSLCDWLELNFLWGDFGHSTEFLSVVRGNFCNFIVGDFVRVGW